ncbi:MAG: long-chain fatty acid--CoA ligase [Phototrophicales bacterium]|nr:MAG: long-chain fatty acid--CoA ligase [Phototrophicales bacterium]
MVTIDQPRVDTKNDDYQNGERIVTSPLSLPYTELPPNADTLPKQLLLRVAEFGDRVAMRKKVYGIWQEYTWRECLQHVQNFCLGLVSLGLKRGETVAIIGENDLESFWGEMAAHSAGAKTVCIFTDANLRELEYLITDSDAVFLLAHDQEQCDKALDLRDKLPNIRKVIYWDDRGLWNYDDDWLMSFSDIEALGREYEAQHPGRYKELVMAGNGEETAILSYTSGTTSLPKGAMISHRNLIFGNLHASEIAPSYPTDEYLSFSPLAWITEQSLGMTGYLRVGFTVNFPEGPETVLHDLREIAPNQVLLPSRLWESVVSTVQVRINDSFWINRKLFHLFLPLAYHLIDLEDAGKSIPLHLKIARKLGDVLVFHPLRDKLGMTNMRNALSSGAVLSPDQLRFLRAIGILLKNLYGSTECQTHTLHSEGDIRLESVGTPPPGVELKIVETGEIYIRSRSVFQGYYKKPDKTAEALDSEGWFHTGDAGYIDAHGHLIYLDRLKDMIELANGERFSPQYIEGRLKFSPYIQDVMALGNTDVDFVSAIVIIDFENVSRWAEKNAVSFTTFVDLSQKPEIYDLITQDIERVNATLPEQSRIRKFVILHKVFDADEAELTRTRKLRRSVLEDKYGDLINAMYNDRDEVTVRAEVQYQDGRSGVIEMPIQIRRV